MSAARENLGPPLRRCRSTRLARPLWIGLAIVFPIVIAAAVFAFTRPTIPHFRNATLCCSRADGDEFVWAGLQDPQSPHVLIPGALAVSMRPKGFKFVDRSDGTEIQIEWRLL